MSAAILLKLTIMKIPLRVEINNFIFPIYTHSGAPLPQGSRDGDDLERLGRYGRRVVIGDSATTVKRPKAAEPRFALTT
jgi:hypothetical protein